MKKIATRDSWKNQPITDPKKIGIDLRFNREQFQIIKKGHIPECMDDLWFIFFEDDTLYFHKSWSGRGRLKAKFTKKNDEYVIEEFFAERNKNFGENENNAHRHDLISLISFVLLNIDAEDWYFKLEEFYENNLLKMLADSGKMLFK